MTTRASLVIALLLGSAARSLAGPTAPALGKDQRTILRAVVVAVDTAAAAPDTPDIDWQAHVLRASDGSHYVAFSFSPSSRPSGPVAVYVRLATRREPSTIASREHSAVMDWLMGERGDPLAQRPGSMISVPTGELPVGGPAINGRSGNVSEASTALRLMTRARDKARDEQADRERQRREDLEHAKATPQSLFPFEDFSLSAVVESRGSQARMSRSLIAGPGDYDLFIGWAPATPAKGAPPAVQVVKHALHLPSASPTELAVSSVIVADGVAVRTTPYPPDEQTAHPYAIGLTEIAPAADAVFTPDERLVVAFQVINPHASDTGKPDVAVGFRIVKVVDEREQSVAALTPQLYTADTLPQDFDVRLGHPVFAAMAAPLSTLRRGTYRLKILVNDRLAGRSTSGDVDFTILGTPAALLAEAPAFAAPFVRQAVLQPAILDEVVRRLTPPSASPALSTALLSARERRFVDLVRDEPVATAEQAPRATLTAIALYALGDPSSLVQFQRARLLGAPAGVTELYLGAVSALAGRDADAVTAWNGAIAAGMPGPVVLPLVVDAHLRRGDGTGAMSAAEGAWPGAAWRRERAEAAVSAGRLADAIAMTERRVSDVPGDDDAQWLQVHALFASVVRDRQAHAPPSMQDRFVAAARAYINRPGVHAALAIEWLRSVAPTALP